MLKKVMVSYMTYESWIKIISALIVNNIAPNVYNNIHLSHLNDFKLSSNEIA